uniref:Uncharacterized protein n=1 Tax=Romanomermis culicivorax TaxID=13658 RepID=A0A915KA02_ROMCU
MTVNEMNSLHKTTCFVCPSINSAFRIASIIGRPASTIEQKIGNGRTDGQNFSLVDIFHQYGRQKVVGHERIDQQKDGARQFEWPFADRRFAGLVAKMANHQEQNAQEESQNQQGQNGVVFQRADQQDERENQKGQHKPAHVGFAGLHLRAHEHFTQNDQNERYPKRAENAEDGESESIASGKFEQT